MEPIIDLEENEQKLLERFNYRVTDNASKRRASLKSALRKHPATVVRGALEARARRASGYRRDRLERDITWTRQRRTGLL